MSNATNTTTRRKSYTVKIDVPTVTDEMVSRWRTFDHEQLTDAHLCWEERRLTAANSLVNPHLNVVERRNNFAWMFFIENVLNELRVLSAIVGQRELDEKMAAK